MRGRRLSDDFVSLVYRIYDLFYPDITLEILANKVLSNKGTVLRVLSRRISGTLSQRKRDLGRPRVTTLAIDRSILNDTENSRCTTIRARSNQYGISKNTVQRRIRGAGFHYRKRSQNFLTSAQRESGFGLPRLILTLIGAECFFRRDGG